MTKNYYKIFFTISFVYQIDKKKKITKSFKSDINLNDTIADCKLTDNNVHIKWKEFALKAKLNDLNPPSEFKDALANEKKLVTHRIVNLMNLTEIH